MAKCKNLRTGVGLEGNGMTDRERLIDLMIEAKRTDPETGSFTDYLADYLLEHGVIVPPCKVGDRVYRPSDCLGVVQFVIISFNIYESEMFFMDDSQNIIYLSDIGKTVFLTREEAERALKERENNG